MRHPCSVHVRFIGTQTHEDKVVSFGLLIVIYVYVNYKLHDACICQPMQNNIHEFLRDVRHAEMKKCDSLITPSIYKEFLKPGISSAEYTSFDCGKTFF